MNFHLRVLLYHPQHQTAKFLFLLSPFWPYQMLSSLSFLHYYLILFFSVETIEHIWAGKFCLQLQWCSCPSSTLGHLLPVDATSSREWTPCLSCAPQTVANHPHRQGNDWERLWTEAWMITTKKIHHLPKRMDFSPSISNIKAFSNKLLFQLNNSCLMNSCLSKLTQCMSKAVTGQFPSQPSWRQMHLAA